MSEAYPCQYSSTTLMCVMGSIQAIAFALCMDRDWNQWKLGWDMRLFTVAFTVGAFLSPTFLIGGALCMIVDVFFGACCREL